MLVLLSMIPVFAVLFAKIANLQDGINKIDDLQGYFQLAEGETARHLEETTLQLEKLTMQLDEYASTTAAAALKAPTYFKMIDPESLNVLYLFDSDYNGIIIPSGAFVPPLYQEYLMGEYINRNGAPPPIQEIPSDWKRFVTFEEDTFDILD
tara:strand:+ start:2229 stop:2684 length:456 start_codon:yes stop_codon:yes gene_type:complete